eukprot:GEMP01072705.1.p1 GENE.GEMP01072705.1~~GEMP01072705.1.p1  ORF type:complete len:161 (+),score=42.37 GEMP01072705.1:201-683(+)
MTTRVFVYGTLKRGFYNYDAVLAQKDGGAFALYEGDAVTEAVFRLVGDMYGIPYLCASDTDGSGEARHIHGEVFSVDDVMLQTLDKLEGVPKRYKRVLIHVTMHGARRETWAYVLSATPPCVDSMAHLAHEYTLSFHKEHYVPPGARRDAEKMQPWGGYE